MAINRATRRIAPSCVETVVLEGASAERDDPLAELIARERAERLWEAIAQLKPLDREALCAFYIQGESLVEIATRLDVPLGTVKRRLHTARKRLKAILEGSVSDADEWSDGQAPERDELEDESSESIDFIAAGTSAAW
jgi:RNA polymerase sigma-70 factor (ECF subfamily)